MIKRWLASSAAATALLVVQAAAAQQQYTAQGDSPQWLKDRRFTEGPGVRTGNLELHPGIAGEFGYDSNWLLRSTQPGVSNAAPFAPVMPALELRITPSLYLSTMGPARREDGSESAAPTIAFRAGINATYYELIGISSDPAKGIPSNDVSRQRNVGGSADFRLDVLPGRPVAGSIGATYGRMIQPNTSNANPDVSFTQDNINANVDLTLQPSSGTLDWHFGYAIAANLFENQTGSTFTNYTNEAYTRGRWRFRPRTALVYDATLGFYVYANTQRAAAQGLTRSDPLRARIGITGLVTDRFAVLAMLGWGASFMDNPLPQMQQYDSLIANAELKWFLSASPGISKATELGLTLSSIALGYTRDFQSSYLGNFYGTDRGYLKFNYFFAGRALASVEGGVAGVEYPRLYWLNPAIGRGVLLHDTDDPANPQRGVAFTDVRADATVFGEYRFTDTLGLNSTFRYTQNFSNARVEQAPPGATMTGGVPNYYGMAWQRFEVFLGVRWFL